MKKPELNPDGISVKGAKVIYAPKGKAAEYSRLATNPYKGCIHACAYCFSPNVLRMDRKEFNKGAVPRENYLNNLTDDARKYQALGITEQVLFSFTTDGIQYGHSNKLTRQAIINLQSAGLAVCVLSKGGTSALEHLDLFRQDRDAYAATLTSLDADFSKKWEPGAASPASRLTTLKAFHAHGIFTWVSLEPVLDTAVSIKIIEETHEYVDFYKIGRANYLPMTKTTDWERYTKEVLETVNRLGARHYIKQDLAQYLPPNYPNNPHITQHH